MKIFATINGLFVKREILLGIRLLVAGLVAPLSFVVGMDAAEAATTCSGPSPAAFSVHPPQGTFTVSGSVPVGTLLTGWTAWQQFGSVWVCNTNPSAYVGATFKSTAGGPNISISGEDGVYAVYPTSLAGVGLVAQKGSGVSFGTASAPLDLSSRGGLHLSNSWNTPWGAKVDAANTSRWTHGTRYAFVKTGPMTGGVATVSGTVANVGIGEAPAYDNPRYIAAINISGSASFVVPTCATPNVTVPLGQHPETKFPSIGSRGGANGETSDFWIDFTRCYTHSTSISYTLRPLDGAVAGSVGLMNLSPYSTAKGVGIRIMDRRDYPVAFNKKLPFTMSNGSRYIPLRAAMERTGWQTFAGGSVVGYVDFTMSYD